MRRCAWGLALSLVGCEAVDAPPLGECGNGIIEPSVGEDCEPTGQACGGVGTGARACRFVCDAEACPEGFRCGLDKICRRPCVGHEGEPPCSPFETLSTDVSTAAIEDVRLIDVAGDERPEIFAQESGVARIYSYDGDGFVAGANAAPTPDFGVLTRLDPGGPVYLFAARTALPPVGAEVQPSHRQAIISRLQSDLGFREVLVQGPTPVDGGALRLGSLPTPVDLPDGSAPVYLFGFGDDAVWQLEPGALPLTAEGRTDDLLGPVYGQPIRASVAADRKALASANCDAVLYAYRNGTRFFALNPCEAAAPGWSTVPLVMPSLPDGTRLGDGLVFDDANADGLDDIIITTSFQRIYVAYATGDGTFHSESQPPIGSGDGDFDAGVGAPEFVGSLGVVAVGDFNGDDLPDFVTRSTWVRSCTVSGCETCDVPGYRCDATYPTAPQFGATPASLIDRDGDGALELAVLAGDAEESWGPLQPAATDLVIVENPATPEWSANLIPLGGAPTIASSGDIDGDGRSDVVLIDRAETGDALLVVFGGDTEATRLTDFDRIVDAHVRAGAQSLAVVSEDADGSHRRLTLLSATLQHELRSTTKLELEVVPRRFLSGRADVEGARFVAVLGEADESIAVELLTRGDGNFFDASTRVHVTTPLSAAVEHTTRVRAVAVDLDGDDIDELVVFAPDGVLRTLRLEGTGLVESSTDPVAEPYGGPSWPGLGETDPAGSQPTRRDLDGDGDNDVWLLTAENPPRLAVFENRGDGTLDVAGRVLTPVPDVELSACEGDPLDCGVRITAFAPFAGASDRSRSISENALDLVLVSHRALWHWTVDPFAPSTAASLEEVAVVLAPREPLGSPQSQIHVALGDIEGDGVDDVVAAGETGVRWLRGLAVNP